MVEEAIFYKVAMFLEQVQRERIKILSPLISSVRTNANDPSGSGRVQLLINADAWAASGH